jgi:hypothetical protein
MRMIMSSRQAGKMIRFADNYSYEQAVSRLHRPKRDPVMINLVTTNKEVDKKLMLLIEDKLSTVFEIQNMRIPEPEGFIFEPDNKYRRRGQRKHWEKFKK